MRTIYGQLSKRAEGQGGSLRDFKREGIEPFKQDCQICKNLIQLMSQDGQVDTKLLKKIVNQEIDTSNLRLLKERIGQEIVARIKLANDCFLYNPKTGRPKKVSEFPSNLCHEIQRIGLNLLSRNAGTKKTKTFIF